MMKTLIVLSVASSAMAGGLVPFSAGSPAKADEVNRNFNYLDSAKAEKATVDLLTSAVNAKAEKSALESLTKALDGKANTSALLAKADTTVWKALRDSSGNLRSAIQKLPTSSVDTVAKRRIDSLAAATKSGDAGLATRVSAVEANKMDKGTISVDWANVKGKPNLWSWSPSTMVTNWINTLPGKVENNVIGFEAGMGTDSGAIAFQKRAVSGTSSTVLDLHTDGVINSWGADGGIQTNSVTRIDGNGIGILAKLNVGNSAISNTGSPATFQNSSSTLTGWSEGPEVLPAINHVSGVFFRSNASNIDSTIFAGRQPDGRFAVAFKGLTGQPGTGGADQPFWILPDGTAGFGSDLTIYGALKAKSTTPWADYVFEPGYKTMPLKEIEAFAKANGHLPEVPSAAEVQKDGIDLAKMNAILLKKIEELTLHAVEQEKKMEALQAEVREMKTNR